MPHAFKMLARVSRILEQLNNAWDVLRTLTPSEYTEFREDLGPSSGFQSHQYRAIEFLCGNRNAAMLKPHAHRPEIVGELQAILARPSLYDEAIRLLARSGFDVGDERADLAEPRAENAAAAGRVARDLRSARGALDALRTRRKAGRSRGLFPPLALQPRHHGRARDRPQARHRRDARRRVSAPDARSRAVPRTVARPHRALGLDGTIPDIPIREEAVAS